MKGQKLLNLLPWLLLVFVCGAFALFTWTEYGNTLVADFMDEHAPPVTGAAPVQLMAPFWSYSDIDTVTELLGKNNLEFKINVTSVPKLKNTPAKKLHTVYLEHYKDHDVPGELTLEFFNGKLYEVEFNPYIADAYVNVVRNSMGMRPDPRKNGRSESIKGMRRISSNIFLANSRVGRSLRTKPYVIWQDLRLISQL